MSITCIASSARELQTFHHPISPQVGEMDFQTKIDSSWRCLDNVEFKCHINIKIILHTQHPIKARAKLSFINERLTCVDHKGTALSFSSYILRLLHKEDRDSILKYPKRVNYSIPEPQHPLDIADRRLTSCKPSKCLSIRRYRYHWTTLNVYHPLLG